MIFTKTKYFILLTAFLVAGTAEVYAMDTLENDKTSIAQRPAMDSKVKEDLERAEIKCMLSGATFYDNKEELKKLKAVLANIPNAQSVLSERHERVRQSHPYLLELETSQLSLLYKALKERIKEKEKTFAQVEQQEKIKDKERNVLLQQALEKENWELVPSEVYIRMLNKKKEPIPSDLKQIAEDMKVQDEARENRKKAGIEPEVKALIAEIKAAEIEKK